jgi:large subunit ribosomal protein L29
MKRNDITALHQLNSADLAKKEQELQRELFTLRMEKSAGKLKSTARLQTVRADIARVKTIRAAQLLHQQ